MVKPGTGVEILHKKRNYESEVLKKDEQIDGYVHQAIFIKEKTLLVRTNDPFFIYLFELGDKPA